MRPEQEQEAVAAPYRLKDEAQAVLPDPRTRGHQAHRGR